ncbi:MAG: glycoside hydrolase family 48 protein, partial [Ruminiclostridium sp.]
DLGVAGSLANALSYIAAANNDTALQNKVKKLLDYMVQYKDNKGIAIEETRADYSRLNDPVYVPAGWTGKMPNGDAINSSSTFLSIRSNYKNDPDWPRVEAALNAGQAPTFTYHRFWSQSDIALAYGTYASLFPNDTQAGWKPGETTVLLGDVNSDATVDAIDLAVLKKYLLDGSSVTIDTKNADMNSDSVVDSIDYAMLKIKLLSGV